MRAGVSDRELIYFLITTLKVNNLKLKRVKQNYKMNIQSEGVRERRGGSTAVYSMLKTLYYGLGDVVYGLCRPIFLAFSVFDVVRDCAAVIPCMHRTLYTHRGKVGH